MQTEAQRKHQAYARSRALRAIKEQADLRAFLIVAADERGASIEDIAKLLGTSVNGAYNARWKARKRVAAAQDKGIR
jgi:transposase